MTIKILQSKIEINQARRTLRQRGLSCLSLWSACPFAQRARVKLGLTKSVAVGDYIKSWDILTSVEFLQKHVPPSAPVLDLGAYASEILCVLQRLGYTALTGADLNPNLPNMPQADRIHYEVTNFLHTPFAAESFQAITAISVIEHGFQSQPLLREVTRLLRPRGYFIASFDYWPDKIDTAEINIFGMDWRIFSKAEMLSFFNEAAPYGLTPVGPLNFEAQTPVMLWSRKRYTFAWLVLQKRCP